MYNLKEKKIALVSFVTLFAIVIFANAVIATREIKQSPASIQRQLLQTSQTETVVESKETKEKKKDKSINVGMTLIVSGSIIIIIAGGTSVAQYRKQEAY